ncbi:MAG: ParB N-terminal domain-containing protein [Rhizobiaceae bacterium]|nr:ParB N-terminal domain-containing protein [Rhizobiaceae bacterium]
MKYRVENLRHIGRLANDLTEWIDPRKLNFSARDLRKHPADKRQRIADSIRTFGFLGIVVIDGDNNVVSGAQRVQAAVDLGLDAVPVMRAAHLSKAKLRAFRIADNKLAEGSEWDHGALKLEFSEILLDEPGFTLEETGFYSAEIDIVLDGNPDGDAADADGILPLTEAVTRVGDLWLIDDGHKLICGDAKSPRSHHRVMGSDRAVLIATDPPYNVRVRGNVSKLATREFVEGSGELTGLEFAQFLRTSINVMLRSSEASALLYVFMDWRSIDLLIAAGKAEGLELANLCVWNKGTGGMGSHYRSQHELVAVFKQPGEPSINNIQLGKYGRNRSNVWSMPGLNRFSGERDELLAQHPTIKPVTLVADILKDASRRGDIVLDTFAGSGTMLLAAHKTGRRARCIERDPLYCDVGIRRFQKRFGIEAVHAETGLTFTEMADLRRSDLQSPEAA